MADKDYRPERIEFDVADEKVPEILGEEFENLNEATKFIHENAVAINYGLTVNRHMDIVEKKNIRNRYIEVLEDDLPKLEREFSDFLSEYNTAKRMRDDAQTRINAAITEAKLLAKEAKAGLKEMKLDELSTFRIPFDGKYYFYTYIDKRLKLCAIRNISSSENQELFTNGVDNSKIFKHDGEIKSEDGTADINKIQNHEQTSTQEGEKE